MCGGLFGCCMCRSRHIRFAMPEIAFPSAERRPMRRDRPGRGEPSFARSCGSAPLGRHRGGGIWTPVAVTNSVASSGMVMSSFSAITSKREPHYAGRAWNGGGHRWLWTPGSRSFASSSSGSRRTKSTPQNVPPPHAANGPLDKPHNAFTQIERIRLGHGKSPP